MENSLIPQADLCIRGTVRTFEDLRWIGYNNNGVFIEYESFQVCHTNSKKI